MVQWLNSQGQSCGKSILLLNSSGLVLNLEEGSRLVMKIIGLKQRAIQIAAFAVASLILCLLLTACATQNSGDVTSKQDEHSAVEKATITTRTVTFPAAYFSDKTAEEVQANLQEKGCTNITANENGSYTVTMSIDKYNTLVDSMHESVANQLDEMPNSENWPTITSVEYDDQFSAVKLTLSSSKVGLQEAFAPLTAGVISCMYQQIAGQPVSCTVSMVDQSGAELSSSIYPDALDQDQRTAVVAN